MSKTRKFKIEGMTCASCVQVIEDSTKILKNIQAVKINFATETGEFVFSDDFEMSDFYSLMNKLGYRAIDLDDKNSKIAEKKYDKSLLDALITFTLASFVMFFAMFIQYLPVLNQISHESSHIIQAVITSIILFFYGRPYLLGVVLFFTRRISNMNTLIGLGSLTSYFYSLYILITNPHAHSYFEGTAFIISFSLVGHYLDEKAKTKARSSLSSLFKMQIKFASKMIDGKEINTPVVELIDGDIIRIRPGEKIPLDGILIQGESHIDESMITGESQAIFKNTNSKVFAGSLNLEGSIQIKINSSLHTTYISQIVNFVENAQLKKAPIQKYADEIVKYFVPVILVISLATFLIWYFITKDIFLSMSFMISVLVIACPCALGLAVPMAIMLSTVEAAKNGLLISGGDVVEKGSKIDTIIFDKTGTLTSGHPVLTNLIRFKNFEATDEELIFIAASCSQYSNHPLSKAIFDEALKLKIKLQDPDHFESQTGFGIVSKFNNSEILLGNLDLLKKYNINDNFNLDFYNEYIGSYVFMARDSKLVAVFVITDPLKKESRKLIDGLILNNLNVWMLSGDHPGVANKVGHELGIKPENIKSEMKPEQKAQFIESLQRQNFKVAMVGDGINDAPALSKANLSIAMGNGTDIAIDASEVSIHEGKVLLITNFFTLCKQTMKIIRQNLLLSSLYNLICIPIAAGVLYSKFHISLTPMWASLAMGLSSFSVILNSLRLKKSNHFTQE